MKIGFIGGSHGKVHIRVTTKAGYELSVYKLEQKRRWRILLRRVLYGVTPLQTVSKTGKLSSPWWGYPEDVGNLLAGLGS